jgi:GTPase
MGLKDDGSTYVPPERAFLVGADLKHARPLLSVTDSLDELSLLASTAGIEVVGRATQTMQQINVNTFIGPGKVEEIQVQLAELNAEVVIFDDELSPRHQRELERIFGEAIKVLDRSALILDIFAQHARTREGSLQVELAQYEYRLPRLTRQWTHLARQTGGGAGRGGNGGVGLRGPGETQLESDRREINGRIAKLKADIEEVRAHRERHRIQRRRQGVPVIALVGYTNAGKSTLLNSLTGAKVYAADQLFATLDPTTRKLVLPAGKQVVISDTVGFIQKLPTALIAAFRATLEEVSEADMIIHVVDASHPNALQQIDTVEDTLAEIDVPRVPRLLVFNKMDRRAAKDNLPHLEDSVRDAGYAAVVNLSARTGTGRTDLMDSLERALRDSMYELQVTIPYKRGDLVAMIHEQGIVLDEDHTSDGVVLRAHVPPRVAALLAEALPNDEA